MADVAWKEIDCYEVLGVSEDATLAEIRAAYRDATRKAHPDRGGSHDAQVKVNLAFETLSGPLRSEHDAFWRGRRARRGSSSREESAGRSGPRRFTRTGNLDNLWSRTGDKLTDGRVGGGFASAVEARIAQERQRLEDDIPFREQTLFAQFQKLLTQARLEVMVATLALALTAGISVRFPVGWLIFLGLLIPFGKRALGVRLRGKRVSALSPKAGATAREHAHALATESVARDAADFDVHTEALGELRDLLRQPSRPEDPLDFVAARLSAAFFLLGYVPVRWEADQERLLVSRGGNEVVVQLRAADGRALSITQVDRFLKHLASQGRREAYLFSLPGLSDNARERAGNAGVRSFDLDELNDWVPSLLTTGYRGPGGDPLALLLKLRHFVQSLTA